MRKGGGGCWLYRELGARGFCVNGGGHSTACDDRRRLSYTAGLFLTSRVQLVAKGKIERDRVNADGR